MGVHTKKVGKYNSICCVTEDGTNESASVVSESWNECKFLYPRDDSNGTIGFRIPQLGALYAIKSHWTISNDAATIVMPTGTGKTEVMIATVVSECCKKTCIIVPSALLRDQTIKRFLTLGKLREIGAIDDTVKNPVVACLRSSPREKSELEQLLNESNLIVTTMSLLASVYFNDDLLSLLVSTCDTVIIDEAHHVPANSWNKIKNSFSSVRCLQFTATPFRNDGKKIDGELIYNYPLAQAQENGYLKPINFYPVYEFDDEQKDLSVAKKAVELLDADLSKGLPHLLLVRASSQDRARNLFYGVYQKYYSSYAPVLVISGNKKAANDDAIQKAKEGKSKIIVCVDMFSEGIDIPQLKICAIHDKYKSLPITIQFIGRFARTQSALGEASVVANVVDDDIQESLEELYSQDADWNRLLKDQSDKIIKKEVELQKLLSGFTGTEEIPLSQIRPKVSMCIYTTTDSDWNWKGWERVFRKENSHFSVNEEEKILIITELCSTRVDWTTCKELTDDNWNLHILYWNEKKKVFYINTTDKGVADRLAEAVFEHCSRIKGEQVFRCLHGIKRLMLSTVGLKTVISSHHIRYRMFAGVDVAEGISGASRGTSTKSNLFGVGFENETSISIGCSYKGTIWAKWVETIDYWKNWCDKQAEKILDPTINTSEVLEGALIPEEVAVRPSVVPYRIDFPAEIETDWKGYAVFKTELIDLESAFVDIRLTSFDETSTLRFRVGNESFQEEFSLELTESGFSVNHRSGSVIRVRFGRNREISLKEYFNDNPPLIWFVDGSSLEGNLLVKLKTKPSVSFPKEYINPWDWSGVDLTKESQKKSKEVDSIQYKLITVLKALGEYSVIFDDDGPGEVADVVAIREDPDNTKLVFELYHCKFSGEKNPGARVGDLYEVCGQAEKCTKWANDAKNILAHLIKREKKRITDGDPTRFEQGNSKSVYILKNKLKIYSFEIKAYIVQPGVDSTKLTPDMHQVLCSTEAYLKETYGIPLELICS